MHSVTDRQTDRRTDGRHDDANSQSYSVAVRSAKNRLRPRDRPTFLTMTHSYTYESHYTSTIPRTTTLQRGGI